MIYLVSEPAKQIDIDSGGNPVYSRWTAANNPNIFSVIRKDLIASNFQSANGGNATYIQLSAPYSIPGSFINNLITSDTIYVSSSKYTGVFKVLAVPGNSIIIDTPFVGNSTGYINLNNQLTNYYVKITLFTKILPSKIKEFLSFDITTFSDGTAQLDPREYLKTLLRFNNDYDYTKINIRDNSLSGIYRIQLQEFYDGSTIGPQMMMPTYYFTNSAKQIQDKYGQNMAEYVPLPTGEINNPNFIKSLNSWVESLNNTNGGYFKFAASRNAATFLSKGTGNCLFVNNTNLIQGTDYTITIRFTINTPDTFASVRIGSFSSDEFTGIGTYTKTFTLTSLAANDRIKLFCRSERAGMSPSVVNFYYIKVVGLPCEAKFLTEFPRPTYFTGFPFELNFIYSEFLTALQIGFNEQRLNINGSQISTAKAELDSSQEQFINHLIMEGGYDCGNVDSVNVWLDYDGTAADNCYVKNDYWQDGYVGCEINTIPIGETTDLQYLQPATPVFNKLIQFSGS